MVRYGPVKLLMAAHRLSDVSMLQVIHTYSFTVEVTIKSWKWIKERNCFGTNVQVVYTVEYKECDSNLFRKYSWKEVAEELNIKGKKQISQYYLLHSEAY
jgi:hypothetical protein